MLTLPPRPQGIKTILCLGEILYGYVQVEQYVFDHAQLLMNKQLHQTYSMNDGCTRRLTPFGIEFMMSSTIEHRATTSKIYKSDLDEQVARPSANKDGEQKCNCGDTL